MVIDVGFDFFEHGVLLGGEGFVVEAATDAEAKVWVLEEVGVPIEVRGYALLEVLE